jgi:Yip1 domain
MSVTAAPPPAMPTPEPAGSDNPIGRIVGVIVNPKPTFASIAARPTWILPVVILMILSGITVFVFTQRVGWRQFMVHQNEQSERTQKQMENMTPDQRDQMLDTQVKWASKIGYISSTVGILIAAAIVAGVLLLGFMVIAGVRPTYTQTLGIVSHAWVGPGIIASLLGILILFLKDPSTIDLNSLVASNVGALMPDDTAKWLKTLLGSIDVFAFWNMLLMAFGFSAVDPKRLSVGKAFGIIFALFLIWTLVKTGLSAAFS